MFEKLKEALIKSFGKSAKRAILKVKLWIFFIFFFKKLFDSLFNIFSKILKLAIIVALLIIFLPAGIALLALCLFF